MKVIGTAGHIDHGKSTLVRRLTGIDPDRLEEEKRRGMTIDLGFAWLTLPSGEDVSIVDVPGHERFVKNMLAGAAGIDVALLVVAADEAVMPQTREHLDILDLLGVRAGVVALTKTDLVDEEWQELAIDDVARLLVGTTLEGSPIVPVSAATGAGIDQLLTVVDHVVSASPGRADRGLPFMPVDRVFTVAGFGTVVTGTLHAGSLHAGREVEILPSGRKSRVRSLQTHRRQVESAEPGARVAVNLTGVAKDQIARGDVLAVPSGMRAVRRFDAYLRMLKDAPFPLSHGTEVSLHIGAAERSAIVSLLDGAELEPGQSGWVQFRLSDRVPAIRQQRFIVRLPAPARTIAGGEVVDILPRHRRSDAAALARLDDLRSPQLERALRAVLLRARPRTVQQMAVLVGADEEVVGRTLRAMEVAGQALRLAGSYLSADGWAAVRATVARVLADYHRENPLRRGMSKEELRSKVGWNQTAWTAALELLIKENVLREYGALVAAPNHAGGTEERQAEAHRVVAALQREPFAPPSGSELLLEAHVDVGLLAAMVEEGSIVRVAEGLYFSREAYDRMVETTLQLLRAEGQITVARIRDALSTSRKYALAFLEHLDKERVTRRRGDVRLPGTRAPECA